MDGTTQILVDLTGRVDGPGDSWSYSGTLALDGYEQGGKEFSLVDGVTFDAVFTNAGDGILLTGMVRAEARGTCDRCLEPASFEIAGELQEYYLFREPEGADDEDYELLPEDRVVDLFAPVADAVVMDTPFVVLCRPDCKGLCPVCGRNLNLGSCDCAERAAEEAADDASNPFAVLKDLHLGE